MADGQSSQDGKSTRGRSGSLAEWDGRGEEDESILGNALSPRKIEAFGRKVTTTAGHLIGPLGDPTSAAHYQNAMGGIHREMQRRPAYQRQVFSLTHTAPSELVRSKLSPSEIQYRALTYLPDEMLASIPENENAYSLFEGFQASVPDQHQHPGRRRRRHSRGRKLLNERGYDEGPEEEEKEGGEAPPNLAKLKKRRLGLGHELEMLGVRKNMSSAEIREIDHKIANLNGMRQIVLDRLAGLENEESLLEHDMINLDNDIEDMQDQIPDTPLSPSSTVNEHDEAPETPLADDRAMDASFMSESIYEKLPSPTTSKARRPHKTIKRKSLPILHEHYEPGSNLKELPAHNDTITALDFDYPFGTLVTAALDDTVRAWDLNAGRCIGLLEGHHASVRCLQVEDNIVATGSMDASIRLWDLSRANYSPAGTADPTDASEEDDGLGFGNDDEMPPAPPASSMSECPLFTLEAHVDEVTALHFRGDTLVSGSADKTLRQWDLQKGRCVQTLDVLWAAAQSTTTTSASASAPTPGSAGWRARTKDADFVGALQCFDAALACGTADGMVRLWDLRSGQVHRSLVGHTGPVTALQFDDVHLVTGSLDRSIRIWDLRTGSIHDAFAFDNPISSMQFDVRRIAAAAGEDVVKIYDKADARHWDCGAGVAARDEAAESGGAAGGKSVVERIALQDGYLVEGRKDGMVGVWSV